MGVIQKIYDQQQAEYTKKLNTIGEGVRNTQLSNVRLLLQNFHDLTEDGIHCLNLECPNIFTQSLDPTSIEGYPLVLRKLELEPVVSHPEVLIDNVCFGYFKNLETLRRYPSLYYSINGVNPC